jgi:hypothetical protein
MYSACRRLFDDPGHLVRLRLTDSTTFETGAVRLFLKPDHAPCTAGRLSYDFSSSKTQLVVAKDAAEEDERLATLKSALLDATVALNGYLGKDVHIRRHKGPARAP